MLRWIDCPTEEPAELQRQMWRILAESEVRQRPRRDLSVRIGLVVALLVLPALALASWVGATALGLGVR